VEVTPLKMRSLLKNLAQLQYARFKRPELFAVLQHLGWTIRPTIDVYEIQGREDYRTEKDAQRRLAGLQAQEVHTKPARPEAGRTYIANPRYQETMYGHTVSFDGWRADEALEVSDPSGRHSFVMTPEEHARVRKRDRIPVDKLVKWLLVLPTSVVDQARAAVKDYEQQRRAQAADTDSGTCGACLRNIKVEDKPGAKLPVMVLHGYRRPGTGHVHGHCLGVGFPPYELSAEATKLVLENENSRVQGIAALQRPGLTVFDENVFAFGMKPRIVTKADAGAAWPMLLEAYLEKVRGKLAEAEAERDIWQWLVDHWKKRPLPVEGEPVVDWYSEASRATRSRR
jgi:hypothetical protein